MHVTVEAFTWVAAGDLRRYAAELRAPAGAALGRDVPAIGGHRRPLALAVLNDVGRYQTELDRHVSHDRGATGAAGAVADAKRASRQLTRHLMGGAPDRDRVVAALERAADGLDALRRSGPQRPIAVENEELAQHVVRTFPARAPGRATSAAPRPPRPASQPRTPSRQPPVEVPLDRSEPVHGLQAADHVRRPGESEHDFRLRRHFAEQDLRIQRAQDRLLDVGRPGPIYDLP